MALNDTVVVDAAKWHSICHALAFERERREQFEKYFDCTIKWKSRLAEWDGFDDADRPDPVFVIKFHSPANASRFVLNWL